MSKLIRYGLIGSGQMGAEHILSIRAIENAKVVAIAEPNEKSRELASLMLSKENAVSYYDNYLDMLESTTLDAVVIATPNMTHQEILLGAMKYPVDILVEKPLAISIGGARAILEASRDRSNIVWVGMEYRYMPPVAELVKKIRSGYAGDVKMISIKEHRYPFLQKVGNWNRFNENTGGTLVEKCCHFFDLMRLISQSEPVSVMASGGQDVNHLDENYDGRVPDIIDNAFVIVNFENGVRAMLDLCMFGEAASNEHEIEVTGNIGQVSMALPASTVISGTRKGGRTSLSSEHVEDKTVGFQGFHHGSTYLEHIDFIKAIENRNSAVVGLEDGMVAVGIGVAAQLSIRENKVVKMSEIL